MDTLFLGVDGGQTSTVAMIGDRTGRILGWGRGGPCSYVRAPDGRVRFVAAMKDCLSAACRSAGLELGSLRFAAAVLGFSGGAVDRRPVLEEMFQADILTVTSDVEVALTGAMAGDPGIITIAGTGSVAFGKNAAGEKSRAGGWGPLFGDEGGAFDLARQALRAALRDQEGWGPPTVLHASLLVQTGEKHVHDLVRRFYTVDFPPARIASYAKLVDRAARQGDPTALEILEKAAADLAQLADAVWRRLFAPGEITRVAYVGGTFRIRAVLDRFRSIVEKTGDCVVAPPVYAPVVGALIDAYAAMGLRPCLSDLPDIRK